MFLDVSFGIFWGSGVKKVDVDLENQVVKILGSLPVKIMADALEQTGRRTRLIGQGCPEGKRSLYAHHGNFPF